MIRQLPSCDVLVVGAGPAGSMAAGRIACAGISTWLIDARRRIGVPPHCAEFVPPRLFAHFDISSNSIIQKIDSMQTTIINDKDSSLFRGMEYGSEPTQRQNLPKRTRLTSPQPIETPSPGFIIDRVQFDRGLAHNAARKGATVLCDTRLLAVENDRWLIRRGTTVIACRPKYVVAADGAQSTAARLLKLPRPKFMVGVQVEAPLNNPSNHTMVFLHRCFTGGYGWVFPKGMAANVGVGLEPRSGVRPWAILGFFVEYLAEQHIIHRSMLATSRGLIPVSGPRHSLLRGNVLFCGDAAALTHPVTGAGVSQAIISGDLAGRLIATAMTTDTPEAVTEYDAEMKSHFGNVMRHALSKRRLMIAQWDHHDFETICRSTWIAYKGYKKRTVGETIRGDMIHA